VIIKTSRFGEVEIDKDRAIHFPDGILGFPEQKDYVILEHKPGSPFCWLQCLTVPDLAFVMTDPLFVKSDFLEDIPPQEKALVTDENNGRYLLFSLVTIPQGEPEKSTVNLLGPIVIYPESKTGRQVILANSGYNHRHPLVFK
jgi:flagellar assembly factor FliW